MNKNAVANVILRVGVAFAFLYAAIDGFIDPSSWVDYFPQFVLQPAQTMGISDVTALHIFAVVEIVLALWILSGIKIVMPSLLAVVMLVLIVALNLQEFQLLFRDLTIAAAALALAINSMKKTESPA
jgi:uncharacterized membrane protein YphA (DoxX/SURF4 family)